VSRDFDPNPGQWYEDLDREEIFKVVSVDPDEMLVRIQWLDGEYEDLDLELAEEPEGWVDEDEDVDDEDEDDLDDEEWEDEEDEDDWDEEDEDEDYDDDDDEYRDRE
jgi:hypothetical protein